MSDAPSGRQARAAILLVEGNLVNRFTVGRALRGAGYDVREADTGQDALTLASLENQIPELVIADFSLPDMSGVELCRLLRESAGTSGIPVLVLAPARSDDKAPRPEPGMADAWLTHPIEPLELLTMTRALLGQRQGQRQLGFQAQLLGHVREALVAIDNEFRITYANPAAEALYGVASADVVGRTLDAMYRFRWIGAGDEQTFQSALAASGRWDGETVQVRRDGTEIAVFSSVSMLKDEHGARLGLLSVARDIGAEKQLVEAARQGRDRLGLGAQSAGLGGEPTPMMLAESARTAEAQRFELEAAHKAIEMLRSEEAAGRARVDAARADAEAARAQSRLGLENVAAMQAEMAAVRAQAASAKAESESARVAARLAHAESESAKAAAKADVEAALADAQSARAEARLAESAAQMALTDTEASGAIAEAAGARAEVANAERDAARAEIAEATSKAVSAKAELNAALAEGSQLRVELTSSKAKLDDALAQGSATRAELATASASLEEQRAASIAARRHGELLESRLAGARQRFVVISDLAGIFGQSLDREDVAGEVKALAERLVGAIPASGSATAISDEGAPPAAAATPTDPLRSGPSSSTPVVD